MYKGARVLLYIVALAELLPWLTGRSMEAYLSWPLWIVGGISLAIASLEQPAQPPAADFSQDSPDTNTGLEAEATAEDDRSETPPAQPRRIRSQTSPDGSSRRERSISFTVRRPEQD